MKERREGEEGREEKKEGEERKKEEAKEVMWSTFRGSKGAPRKPPPRNPQNVSFSPTRLDRNTQDMANDQMRGRGHHIPVYVPVLSGSICWAYIHSIICSLSSEGMVSMALSMSSPHRPKNRTVIL